MTVMDLVDRLNRQAGEKFEQAEEWLDRSLAAIPVWQMRRIVLLLLSVPVSLSLYALVSQGGLGYVVLLILASTVSVIVMLELHHLDHRVKNSGDDKKQS